MDRTTRVRLSCLLMLANGIACGGGAGSGSPAAPSTPVPAPGTSIGPAGGTLEAASGAVRLSVPAGALTASVALSLRTAGAVPLDPHALAGAAFELGPVGTTFGVPATLTIRYAPDRRPSGSEEADLRLHALSAGSWQPLGGNVDTAAREASASVAGAGTYGVRWPGPSGSCAAREHRQFDFWLGSWTFLQGNLPPAGNEITSEAQGCLIEERFEDPNGGQGRSVSVYSPRDGQWHQTYVDSRGTRLVLVGVFDGRRMVLNETPSQRYVWDPLDGATVRYFGERTSDGGQSYSVFFDSTYRRR